MKTIGERIADLRRERGITQENLAGTIGVSPQAISKWENNATMPDIMLLPIIADTLGVTIDELFGIRHKVQEKPINCEETPMAVYDQILNTMWRSEDNDDFAERAKAQFAKNPYQHSGFVSEVAGAVYANKDIALSYLPSDKESLRLLENEETAELLKVISDKNVRLVLAYQYANPKKTFTASSVAAKIGISEEEAKAALEKLFDCNLTMARDVDTGVEETLRIYQASNVFLFTYLHDHAVQADEFLFSVACIGFFPKFMLRGSNFPIVAVGYNKNLFRVQFFQVYVPPFNRFLLGQKRLIRRASTAYRKL